MFSKSELHPLGVYVWCLRICWCTYRGSLTWETKSILHSGQPHGHHIITQVISATCTAALNFSRHSQKEVYVASFRHSTYLNLPASLCKVLEASDWAHVRRAGNEWMMNSQLVSESSCVPLPAHCNQAASSSTPKGVLQVAWTHLTVSCWLCATCGKG